jgi:enoyl-[acyl-carrier protein] reductase I
MTFLAGKKGLVVGIANEHSLAYGCAKAFREAGAELAVTYYNEKTEPHVRPLAEALDCPIVLSCDVAVPSQLEAVFEAIRRQWGRLDFALHAVGHARKDDLRGRLADCTSEGFSQAMDVSVHSFIRMAHLAEPLMANGGCLLAIKYYGAEKAVPHYNVMGPVKAALETAVRYLAVELSPKGIRVNALSPGPVKTRAASGIDHFDELLAETVARAPEHRLVTPEEVGSLAAFLVSDQARAMTGNVEYIDAGYHAIG